MANEPLRYNAGVVTAYGAAVRGGYTGTYEDFCRQQAGYAESAAAVEHAKEEAVEAANENAVHNGIENCKFLAGDVFKVLDEIAEKPDVIVLDPPRDGIHPKALPKILDYGVDTIVYISCKVTSLARDLEMIQARGYRVVKATVVDQFVHTVHVEVIIKMQLVDSKKNSV